jgi:hypothetical protein
MFVSYFDLCFLILRFISFSSDIAELSTIKKERLPYVFHCQEKIEH